MERVFNFIKEWASVFFFAMLFVLVVCGVVVCTAQLLAGIGVFMASCGLIGCLLSAFVFGYELFYEIKSKVATELHRGR